jgi:hypothetical protein
VTACTIQSTYRGRLVRRRFLILRGAARLIQGWFHTKIARMRFLKMRSAAVVMQARRFRIINPFVMC